MSFNDSIYNLCKKIPKGKVSTYKLLSEKLNSRAYRAVGNALNRNKSKQVPCHRVILSSGKIGGFARGTRNKIKLLKKEGIVVINNKVYLKRYLHKF